MDLSYSDEQRLLRESADGLLSARAQRAGGADLWSEMAELGWLALPLPEEYDGLGQGAVDVAILTECFGRHRVRAPYAPAIVVCGGLLAALGDPAQKAALLTPLAQGRVRLALAHAEEGARHCLAHVAARAERTKEGWRLTGRKIAALGGDVADRLIVSARIDGETRDARGVGLFLVDPAGPGVTVEPFATVDGGGAARVTLTQAEVGGDALLGGSSDASPALEAMWDRAIAAWCSELVGLMEAATAATIEYTKIRVQFGKPLAANQALRHRMADMSILCEEARSMALRAALHAESADFATRARAVSGAWAKISKAARFVAEQAIQLHGGMGVTDELQIGGFLKRVVALDAIIGGPDHHMRRHAALSDRNRRAA